MLSRGQDGDDLGLPSGFGKLLVPVQEQVQTIELRQDLGEHGAEMFGPRRNTGHAAHRG